MDLMQDILSVRPFNAFPLIPYLMEFETACAYGYVNVVLDEEEMEDCVRIIEIASVYVRKGAALEKKTLPSINLPIVLRFEKGGLEKYEQNAETYFELLQKGDFVAAKALFNEIASEDLKNLFENIFNGGAKDE